MLGSQVSSCRACGSPLLEQIVDLGSTPIANGLVEPDGAGPEDPTYPLNLLFCEACSLVQLGYELPAEAIFGTDYPYYTSYSDTLCAHAASHVESLLTSRALGPHSLAIEIASNDGYLLRNFVAAGVRTLGVDPAPGPAAVAEDIGVPTVVDFFGVDLARSLVSKHGQADVVIANNVMAHVPNLDDFVGGFAELLSDDGILTVENPWVRSMVDHVEFDMIYHEHYCYYSCSSVDALMGRHGLHLNDVEFFSGIHGGSLRWSIGQRPERTDRCQGFLDAEEADGLTRTPYYGQFSSRIHDCQQALRETLEGLRTAGRTVAAYGAAAKGATLLNSAGIGADLVDYVVDRNVHKQGKLIPGCRLLIRPSEVLVNEMPDDVLLLAWNFAEEIARQQWQYLERGGRFWTPVPLPSLISSGDLQGESSR